MSYHKTRRPVVRVYKTRAPKYGPIVEPVTPSPRLTLLSPRNDRCAYSSPSRAGEMLELMMRNQEMTNGRGFRNAKTKRIGSRHHVPTMIERLAKVQFG